MRTMRIILTALFGLSLLATGAAQEDCSHGASPDTCVDCGNRARITKKQRSVKGQIDKLQGVMSALIKKLREQGQEHYAANLEKGLDKLNNVDEGLSKSGKQEDTVYVQVRNLLNAIEQGHRETSVQLANKVTATLQALLLLLEDRTNPEELESRMKDIKAALEKIKEIKKEQIKINKETEGLQDREIEEMRRDLTEMIEQQKKLQNMTQSGKPQDLMKQVDEMVKQIDQLQATHLL